MGKCLYSGVRLCAIDHEALIHEPPALKREQLHWLLCGDWPWMYMRTSIFNDRVTEPFKLGNDESDDQS